MAISADNDLLFRLDADQYEKMAEIGILPEHGVELIDGLVVKMSAQGDRHVVAVRRLNKAFTIAARDRYAVDVQSTALVTPSDEPDPDIVISRNAASLTRASSADIALIVEVANTSLSFDLETKLPRYALAGVPEYWVVDLVNDVFRMFRSPGTDGTYCRSEVVLPGGIASPFAYPDVEIFTAIVLGINF